MINLQLLDQQGFREVVLPCASCFSRFRTAVHEWESRPEVRDRVEAGLGGAYADRVEVWSLLDYVVRSIGLKRVRELVRRSLMGLKVACYYGCLLTRPPKVTRSEDYEYSIWLDRLMEAVGASPLDWDCKTACCGGSLALTETRIVLDLGGKIIANARQRGADMIVVACPLCEINLQGRRREMGVEPRMPIVYFTQLLAIALGREREAVLGRNLVDPRPALRAALGGNL